MKYIMCSPSNTRYLWEDEIAITNLTDLGVDPKDIIFLYENNKSVESVNCINKIKEFNVNVFDFEPRTNNLAKEYIPSVRPYLWWKFLSTYPEYENEDFMYQDSDIIYRRLVTRKDFPNLSSTHWYGADVESYVGYDYLKSKEVTGKDVFEPFKQYLGVSEQSIKSTKGRVVGAQWAISKPRAEYWHAVYVSCYTLYHNLKTLEKEYLAEYKKINRKDYYIQIWCSEMYTQMYLLDKYGITTEKSKALDFNWTSDNINDIPQDKNILHNAGITEDMLKEHPQIFHKGIQLYKEKSPWDAFDERPMGEYTDLAIDEYTLYMVCVGHQLKEKENKNG